MQKRPKEATYFLPSLLPTKDKAEKTSKKGKES